MKYQLFLANLQVVRTRHMIKVMFGAHVVYEFIPGNDVDRGKVQSIATVYSDSENAKTLGITEEDLYQMLLDSIEERLKEDSSNAKPDSHLLSTIVRFSWAGGSLPTISVSGKVQLTFSGLSSSVYVRQDWRISLPLDLILEKDRLIHELRFEIEEGDVIFDDGYPVGTVRRFGGMDKVEAFYYLDRNEPKGTTINEWENKSGLDY